MKNNIICHLHCTKHKKTIDCLEQLKLYNHIFDGFKIATVSMPDGLVKIQGGEKEFYDRQFISEVLLELYNMNFFIIPAKNSIHRESEHFFKHSGPLLKYLLIYNRIYDDPGWTFYCHNKGASYAEGHPKEKAIDKWTKALWKYNIHHYEDKVKPLMDNDNYDFIGSFKKKARGQWHYSGTFFWARNNVILENLINDYVQRFKSYAIEFLPGLLVKHTRMYSLISNDAYDYYSESSWSNF